MLVPFHYHLSNNILFMRILGSKTKRKRKRKTLTVCWQGIPALLQPSSMNVANHWDTLDTPGSKHIEVEAVSLRELESWSWHPHHQ